MSHAPGPWTLIDRGMPVIVAGEGTVAVLSTGTLAGPYTDDRLNANARLIAAAPDLLVALTELLTLYLQFENANFDTAKATFDNARAAIRKAEGQ